MRISSSSSRKRPTTGRKRRGLGATDTVVVCRDFAYLRRRGQRTWYWNRPRASRRAVFEFAIPRSRLRLARAIVPRRRSASCGRQGDFFRQAELPGFAARLPDCCSSSGAGSRPGGSVQAKATNSLVGVGFSRSPVSRPQHGGQGRPNPLGGPLSLCRRGSLRRRPYGPAPGPGTAIDLQPFHGHAVGDDVAVSQSCCAEPATRARDFDEAEADRRWQNLPCFSTAGGAGCNRKWTTPLDFGRRPALGPDIDYTTRARIPPRAAPTSSNSIWRSAIARGLERGFYHYGR